MPNEQETKPYLGEIWTVTKNIRPDGRIFEKAIRSPGTRVIIHDLLQEKIYISKEFREEINDYDYRLPGGKVRDSRTEWEKVKDDPDIKRIVEQAAQKEARQEAGVEINNLNIFTVSTSGGPTCVWDLHYFVTTDFSNLPNQDLETGEIIETNWFSITEIIEICLSGKMKEGRSAAVLLQYLHSIGKI
jgi:ADP-ribose pyrophosphatase